MGSSVTAGGSAPGSTLPPTPGRRAPGPDRPQLDLLPDDPDTSTGLTGWLVTGTRIGCDLGILLVLPLGEVPHRRCLVPAVLLAVLLAGHRGTGPRPGAPDARRVVVLDVAVRASHLLDRPGCPPSPARPAAG